MKKLFFITIAVVSLFIVNSCKERKTSNVISVVDSADVDVPTRQYMVFAVTAPQCIIFN